MKGAVKGRPDNVLQSILDICGAPEEALEVLHPFEVRNDDTAGIRKNIGDHEDAVVCKDRSRPPASLDRLLLRTEPDISTHVAFLLGDLFGEGRRDKDGTLQLKEFLIGDAHLPAWCRATVR